MKSTDFETSHKLGIYKQALYMKFNGDIELVDTIMDLAINTNNVDVAIGKILGTYNRPTLFDWANIDDRECKLVHVNDYTERVRYKYNRLETSGCYFPKGWTREQAEASPDRFTTASAAGLSYMEAECYSFPTGKTETAFGETSLEKWQKCMIDYSMRVDHEEKDIL